MKLILSVMVFLFVLTEARENQTDNIDVEIGAGYRVGWDQDEPPPKSTTKVLLKANPLSQILTSEVIPQKRRVAAEKQPEPSGDLEPELAESVQSNNFVENQSGKPKFEELEKIVNKVEDDDYSKIIQIVRVPAIYEIHLQTKVKKKSKPLINHFQNLPTFTKVKNNHKFPLIPVRNLYGKRDEVHLEKKPHVDKGNILYFGKKSTKPIHLYQNRQILDTNQPQALYEVPAPYLGSAKSIKTSNNNFKIPANAKNIPANTKNIPATTFKIKTQPLMISSLNLYSTLTPSVPFTYKMSRQHSPNYNNNLFNTRRRVGFGRADRVFFTTENYEGVELNRGGKTFKNRRNFVKTRKYPPFAYSIYARISERYINDSDKK